MPENLLLTVFKCTEEHFSLSNPLNSGHLTPEKKNWRKKLFQIEDGLVSLFILNQRNQEAINEKEKEKHFCSGIKIGVVPVHEDQKIENIRSEQPAGIVFFFFTAFIIILY